MKQIDAMQHIEVGDIFRASWGYDQTNVDYYRVTRKMKKMVELVEIGTKMGDPTGPFSAKVSPDNSRVIGAPFKRRPTAYLIGKDSISVYVGITSFAVAKKVDESDSTHCSWGQ